LAQRREQHISAFTRTIYFQGIAMSVAFGDCAPLVGHNALLRRASVTKVWGVGWLCWCHRWLARNQ
jgi:hypothetical protein